MNPANYVLFLFLIIILIQRKKKKNWITQHLKLKYRKENRIMMEAVKKFIDKECRIYLLSGELTGVIREVTDNALLLETNNGTQLVNLEFVIRIVEIPRKKNGKKKKILG